MQTPQPGGETDVVVPAPGELQTILFTDVEGSTELRSRVGDREADELLALHEGVIRREIEAHGGHEVAFLGDGFMAAFASPVDAVRAAVAVQRDLAEHARREPGREVRVRIGMHHGRAVEREGTLYGQAVHAASRVSAEAAGRQIFVSDVVREAAAGLDGLAFDDRGLFWLKGFPERWRLFEVEWQEGSDEVAPVPGQVPARAPLVGRDAERADLRRSVDPAFHGQGSLVLVTGEAGVGKTRLVMDVAAEAQNRGARVFVGHSIEIEGGTPYLPWVEILEQALVDPRSPAALREAVGDAGSEMARIVPALRRVLPGLPPPLDLPPEQARRYLWVSVQEFLDRAAQDKPLVLVLEDLHWADESSVLLLEHLASRLADAPILVIGSYRDVEVSATHPLARVVGQLGRRGLVQRIPLRRLPIDDVRSLIAGLSGQEPPPKLVEAIFSESEGNPFFVEEVFLHLAESGRLFDDDGRFLQDLTVAENDVPQSVRLVIGERLSRLEPATRDALAAAAASGRVFATDVVERVSQQSHEGFARSLDEAEQARLIAPTESQSGGHGGTRLEFVHELIRQTLLAELSTVRRQQLHARTADAIEAVHASDLEQHAADLASHLSLSGPHGDRARLVRYLVVAADRAMRASAFEDALAHLEHAKSLLGPDDRELLAEIEEQTALALRSLGQWDEAIRAMDRAFELYEDLQMWEAFGRLCWAMVYHLGWAARFEEAVLVAGKGLGALGDMPNPDRARLLAAGGWIFGLGGDDATAEEMLEQGRELAEELRDLRALADVLHLETIHCMSYGLFPRGIEIGLKAADVFERDGALWDLCSVLSFVEFQAGTLVPMEAGGIGDAALAPKLEERVTALAERLGHLGALFMSLSDRIRREAMAGDLDRVEATARRQIEVCEQGSLPWIYVGHMYAGLAAHWRGDWETAERELRLSVELEPPAAFAGQAPALLAMHLAVAGRADDALALWESRKDALPDPAAKANALGAWNMALGFAEVLFLLGRNEEAAVLEPIVDAALALGTEWISFDCRLVRSRKAVVAAAAGRTEEAEALFAEALAAAEAMGNALEAADVRRLQGRALRAAGAHDRAGGALADASRRYRALGMERFAELCESAADVAR